MIRLPPQPTAGWPLVFFFFAAMLTQHPLLSSSDVSPGRKLLGIAFDNEVNVTEKVDTVENEETVTVTERMDESCSRDDIVVYQGATTPLPNGIPTYTVQILNVCMSGCAVSDIHVSCGWFSSARLVNPSVFRRIGFDDCLVNGGGALNPGDSISFQYANTYRYPLYVSSVSC